MVWFAKGNRKVNLKEGATKNCKDKKLTSCLLGKKAIILAEVMNLIVSVDQFAGESKQ